METRNDIYMGVDKTLVREMVKTAHLNEKGEFAVAQIPVDIIRENGEVGLETELYAGEKLPLEISEAQEKFLKDSVNPFVAAVTVKAGDEFCLVYNVGELEEKENIIEKVDDDVVEIFIKYKGFKSKEDLEDYIHTIKGNTTKHSKEMMKVNVNDLDIEDRKRAGVDFLFGNGVCPVCFGKNIGRFDEASMGGINAYLYSCLDCKSLFCVETNEYNTVTDFKMIEPKSNNTNNKKKKKKVKKKKTFGKKKK